MAGALASHLFFIGFQVHAQLALMLVIALLASTNLLFQNKGEFLKLLGGLKKRPNALQQ